MSEQPTVPSTVPIEEVAKLPNDIGQQSIELASDNFGWIVLVILVLIFYKQVAVLLGKFAELLGALASYVNRLIFAKFKSNDGNELTLEAESQAVQSGRAGLEDNPKDPPQKESEEQEEKTAGISLAEIIDEIKLRNFTIAEEKFQAYLATIDNSDTRHSTTAMYFSLAYVKSRNDDFLNKLQDLYYCSANSEQRKSSLSWLVRSLEKYGQINEVNGFYQHFITQKNEAAHLNEIKNIVIGLYIDNEMYADAELILSAWIGEEGISHEHLSLPYQLYAKMYEAQGDKKLAAMAYEKAVGLSPYDTNLLFSAAYLQDDANMRGLAIKNYNKLVELEPDNDSAWNNLAVCLEGKEVEGVRLGYFQRAIDTGSTLAVANKVRCLMHTGLYDDAESILNETVKLDSVHENVTHALSDLHEKRKEEEVKFDGILKEADKYKHELEKYAEARFSSEEVDFTGVWYMPDAISIEVNAVADGLFAEWTEARKTTIAANTISLGIKPTNSSAIVTYKKRGHLREGLISKATLLGGDDVVNTHTCFSYLQEGKWYIFSNTQSRNFQLVLSRQMPAPTTPCVT